MFVRIGNTPRDYAWGSTTAIAGLLGTEPSGGPEAELWLGAHPGSPARVLDPALADGAADLAAWERTHDLPYLLKVLAADGPLSLQAHPSPEQARAGFDRENAAGLAADSPDRNYKDPFHKPELIFALSDPFEALCGFRDPAESRAALERLAAASNGGAVLSGFARTLDGEPGAVLRRATEWLLGADTDVDLLVAEVVAAARALPDDRDAETVRMLDDAFPGDPGIVLALLLNRATLRPGEVLYLPAGNIHAYLRGLGIELMAASDNVLRGGLTRKRIDVPELVSVLDFSPIRATPLAPEHPAPGVEVFRPDVPDFQLSRVEIGETDSARLPLPGTAIALCTEGTVQLIGAGGSLTLARGEAAVVTADEGELSITSGPGILFVATPNR
ncbi:mannose-6-phosphate isomerase, class I [Leifsonia sp. LS-T14]|uniref:mannose-6-phosphate isomerase, class I n=1 Tax=unclassified Leifsonia TaxID=2663824 RepID=UPI0035A66928